MSDRKIVVSIDFGTTYSGIAWAETTRPHIQHIVSSWPSHDPSQPQNSPKVPTELRKVSSGWQWGFQIPPGAKRIRFFKLKLDDPPELHEDDDESPLELTRIYLSFLHAHFMALLEKHLSPVVVRSTRMEFVVTVPAIWSPAAKQLTERAAAMAGFCGNSRIKLISEPEAAALYVLTKMDPSTLRLGQKFVVCDAGGGTVDLITYELSRLDEVEIKEVTEGTGGQCGSAMLNKRFRRYLKQTHGEQQWTDDRLVLALNEFESYKKEFSPKGDPLTIRVDPSFGLRRNRFLVPQDLMKSHIFEPIIKDIIDLIKEQITMAGDQVTALILVGGFGQSRHLKSKIRDALGSETEVLQPENAWTAVVKGAAIHGLAQCRLDLAAVRITSRIARHSFGTCLLTKYDRRRHNPNEAFWSDKEEEMVATEMCWFIVKGESYPEGQPSSIDFQCDVPITSGHMPQTDIEIFSNELDLIPPVHLTPNTRCVAVLSLDLAKIPEAAKATASKVTMGNHRYYSISGVIEASYGSAIVTYKAKLGGVTHDAIAVQYE